MNDLFDDDIDIFICDLDNSSNQKYLPTQKQPKKLNQKHKTINTRKQSDDSCKQSSKRKYLQKLKEYRPKSQLSSLMKIQQGVQYRDMQKKQRNRLAAKQSRDRKKLYIELMENQHRKLDEDIAKIDEQTAEVRKKISKFVSENKILTGFNTLNQLQSKFDKLLKQKTSPDVDIQINTMLDSMRYRLGATGKQRVRKVNQFFRQIINLSLPPVLRYLIWDATQKKHLFRDASNVEQSDDFCLEFTKCVPQMAKNNDYFEKIHPDFAQKKQELLKSLKELSEIKLFMKTKCNQIQDQIDDIRDILTPAQCLNLLMIINKKRYNQCIDFLNTKFMQQEERPPRKIVKLSQNNQDLF